MSRSKNGSAVASARGGTGAGGGGGPSPSRFRLVRFPAPGGDLRRGRWLCRDFYERDAVPRGWGRVPASLGSPPAPPLPPSADDTAAPPPPHQPRSLGAFVQLVQQALPPGPPSPRPGGGTAGLSACLGLAGEDSEEEGAGSGVTAIDNKIEQAMDLVKGHVLQAVREEVELLREQIRELRERRAALERENGALRALATPQQLARLRPPRPHGPPT